MWGTAGLLSFSQTRLLDSCHLYDNKNLVGIELPLNFDLSPVAFTVFLRKCVFLE